MLFELCIYSSCSLCKGYNYTCMESLRCQEQLLTLLPVCLGSSLGSRVAMGTQQYSSSITSPNIGDTKEWGPQAPAVSATLTQDMCVLLRRQALLCAAISTIRCEASQEPKQALCPHPQTPGTLLQNLRDTITVPKHISWYCWSLTVLSIPLLQSPPHC